MESPTATAVKICGLTNIEQAKAIAKMGADAIGVIGVAGTPRFVIEQQRRNLFSELASCAKNIQRVWVVADLNDDDLANALQGEGAPSVVQLHGNETPERCASLRQHHPNTQWWKALRVQDAESINLLNSYRGQVDAVLLDAWSPDQLGGTGHQIPLQWLQQIQISMPWWLAGGIAAESIPAILDQVTPWGVDASSRLEVSPGQKDLSKVEALLKAVGNRKG